MTPPPRLILSQLQREQIIGALDDPQTTALAERSSDALLEAREWCVRAARHRRRVVNA